MMGFKLLLLLLSLAGIVQSSTNEIRMLNWWNFFPKEVSSNLLKEGYIVKPVEYKSNATVFSKLASGSEKYDIVILSNNILNKVKELGLLDPLPSFNRKYLKFLENSSTCIPLAWSATTFIVKEEEKEEIQTLERFFKSEKQKALIDDPLEILYRISEDNNRTVEETIKNLPKLEGIKKTFKSDIKSFFKNGGALAYGWHGEAADILKAQNLKYELPIGRPVIGVDYACLLKSRNEKISRTKYINFIRSLTDLKNTGILSKKSQYFSPYVSHKNILTTENEEFRDLLIKRINKASYLFIRSPDSARMKRIINWWKEIRYEN